MMTNASSIRKFRNHVQAKATNQGFANSGNKDDATEEMNASSSMRANKRSLGRLPLQGLTPLIRRVVEGEGETEGRVEVLLGRNLKLGHLSLYMRTANLATRNVST